MAGGGGWADLPLDLFSLIFSKLSLPQLLRSAAVCVSWSANARDLSTRSNCFKFRGQNPWLVLYDDPHGDPSAITFYALDERREFTIPVPDPPIRDRLFLGSAHGWIITIDVRLFVQLLNPITGAQIDLPRALLSERARPIRDIARRLMGFMMPIPGEEVEVNGGIPSQCCLEQHHLKAILSADPSLGDGYSIALIHYPSRRILFTRSGDAKWFDLRNSISVENIVFHKGKLYMSTLSEVCVCDLDEAQIQDGEMPRFRVVDRALYRPHVHYFLKTPRGDLFSIWKDKFRSTISIKVYRVMDEEKPSERLETVIDLGVFIIPVDDDRVVVDKSMRLEEANDLEDFIVYLGGCHQLCLPARDFPHLTPNSIYITDDLELLILDREFAEDLIGYWHRYSFTLPMILERMWFTDTLNCPISFSIDKPFLRLYWQPPSSSICQ
ncbi:probable F-box protein At4g22060 [Zingiber officinale]|uniref:probable F-box protein At4g22060 n=1 Tax=Zingiber officinale TaxID=94328 RepID=UPI001C4AA820|nr:probable F-box protein At4g22060 [Zingiber officinale]